MSDVTTFESAFETSGGAQVRRMEVVPVGRVRRSWAPEAKARIIAESIVPQANVAAIAPRHDMLPQHLYAWRREARERMEAGELRCTYFCEISGLGGALISLYRRLR